MKKCNVLIVEDEILIANYIKTCIEKKAFNCVGIAVSYEDAINILNTEKIDIILLDINLFGDKSGIDLAKEINKTYQIPFIYLTSYSDTETIEELKKTYPKGYLSKPINETDLTTTLAINFNNLSKEIDINIGKKTYKIDTNKLLFIQSDHVYLELNFSDKKETIRTTISSILEILPSSFQQISRGIIINTEKVEKITANTLTLQQNLEFKISEKFIHKFKK